MSSLRRLLRRIDLVCLVGIVAYVLAGWLISQLPGVAKDPDISIWPRAMPSWPIAALLALGVLALAVDILAWALTQSRAHGERERMQQLARQWPQRADARLAAATGVQALRVGRFRAQALPAAVRLDWTEPAGSYDRVLVFRSSEGFALSPAGGAGQAVAYEGEESEFVDAQLPGGRVFFYTLFALGRGGQASPPVWAWAVTLRPGERVSTSLDEASPQVPGDQRH